MIKVSNSFCVDPGIQVTNGGSVFCLGEGWFTRPLEWRRAGRVVLSNLEEVSVLIVSRKLEERSYMLAKLFSEAAIVSPLSRSCEHGVLGFQKPVVDLVPRVTMCVCVPAWLQMVALREQLRTGFEIANARMHLHA